MQWCNCTFPSTSTWKCFDQCLKWLTSIQKPIQQLSMIAMKNFAQLTKNCHKTKPIKMNCIKTALLFPFRFMSHALCDVVNVSIYVQLYIFHLEVFGRSKPYTFKNKLKVKQSFNKYRASIGVLSVCQCIWMHCRKCHTYNNRIQQSIFKFEMFQPWFL